MIDGWWKTKKQTIKIKKEGIKNGIWKIWWSICTTRTKRKIK